MGKATGNHPITFPTKVHDMSDSCEASDDGLRDPDGTRRISSTGEECVKSATGHVDVTHQALHAKCATGEKQKQKHKLKNRKPHKIATWNVRGLLQPGKQAVLEKTLERTNISVAGLSELHFRNEGHYTTALGHFMCFSGNRDRGINGVGFWVSKSLSDCILGYRAVSDRIISLRLNGSPSIVHLVQVYAPTSTADDDTTESFFNELESYLQNIPNKELVIIIGDLNSKIGSTVADEHIRSTVGKYGMGERNPRGDRLIQFCLDNSLAITNSMYKHHPRRLYTWTSPDGRHRNQIDYIMIKSRWRTSITQCKTLPGADCGSDHQLLVATLRQKFKVCARVGLKRLPQINDTVQFQNRCIERLENISPTLDTHDSDRIWLSFKNTLIQALTDCESRSDAGSNRKQKVWMTANTLDLVEQRRILKLSGIGTPLKHRQYQRLSRSIQAACRRDKNMHIEKICREIQQHADTNNSKELFDKVRLLTRKFKQKSWAIRNAEGDVQTDLDGVIDVWRSYCESLYANTDQNPTDSPYEVGQEAYISTPSSSTVTQRSPLSDTNNTVFEPEPDILLSEVELALKRLKTNKAAGYDCITADVLKHLPACGLRILHQLCNRIWYTGVWPEDWRRTIIIPLHKKGPTNNCNNYRLLALISHASKVLLYIMQRRLENFISWQIAPEQAGFVKSRGTREQILNVRNIIEKAREYYVPVFICFVDYTKAFDNVRWDKLWCVLTTMGVPEHLTHLISRLYQNNLAHIRMDGYLSDECILERGVRQGCILSPLLFNIYAEFIMRRVLDGWEGGVDLGGVKISNLRFADDTTLLASSPEEITNILKKLEVESAKFGLMVNYSKTKIMVIDRQQHFPVTQTIAGCEVVSSVTYLGALVNNTGGCEPEIRRRIQLARAAMTQLTGVWRDRHITVANKKRLVSTLVFSIFHYACETWTVKESDRRRIDAFEMWTWRRLLRIPWTARRTNVSVLNEIKPSQRLSSTVYSRILKFFGHIHRSEHKMERLLVQGKPRGQRRRGRSPQRWADITKKLLNKQYNEAAHMTDDRDRWRKIVDWAVRAAEAQ